MEMNTYTAEKAYAFLVPGLGVPAVFIFPPESNPCSAPSLSLSPQLVKNTNQYHPPILSPFNERENTLLAPLFVFSPQTQTQTDFIFYRPT
jgi:hypothetical protein